MAGVLSHLMDYTAKHGLFRAGDRVAIAVSGGADSVALLRLLLEARGELGIVLSVAHLNHGIRGAEADADEAFVKALAEKYDLPFSVERVHTPQFAGDHQLGLEAAARRLRHEFFDQLIREQRLNKIATAHTLDDQAETVLLRLMRGAGTKGLAGIHPALKLHSGSVIRPLLSTRRTELRDYLRSIGQEWREDATNSDLSFTRNRVRHRLLPVIEKEFGAATLERFAETAEIARAEEEDWRERLQSLSPRIFEQPKTLRPDFFLGQSLAVQRRLVREAAHQLGCDLEFQHVEQVIELAQKRVSGASLCLPLGLIVTADHKQLRFSREHPVPTTGFSYRVTIPGELAIPELNGSIRFHIVRGAEALSSYNWQQCLTPELTGTELVVRNWHPGDRFWPAHSKSGKKVKELLKPEKVPAAERPFWPVAEHRGEILWVRGLPVAHQFRARTQDAAVVVEELFPEVGD